MTNRGRFSLLLLITALAAAAYVVLSGSNRTGRASTGPELRPAGEIERIAALEHQVHQQFDELDARKAKGEDTFEDTLLLLNRSIATAEGFSDKRLEKDLRSLRAKLRFIRESQLATRQWHDANSQVTPWGDYSNIRTRADLETRVKALNSFAEAVDRLEQVANDSPRRLQQEYARENIGNVEEGVPMRTPEQKAIQALIRKNDLALIAVARMQVQFLYDRWGTWETMSDGIAFANSDDIDAFKRWDSEMDVLFREREALFAQHDALPRGDK